MTDNLTDNQQPSAALLEALAESASAPSNKTDKLDALRAECERLRDDDLDIQDLEARLDDAKKRRTLRLSVTVPDLMDAAGVPEIVIAADGNKPTVRVSVEPYYHANISADWPDEQRRAAFDWLDANACGDLIKTTIIVRFPREDRDAALRAVAALREVGVADVEMSEAVAWNTLTSWLKKRYEKSLPLPALDVIGATVGRVAKIKPVKEK